MLKIPYQKLRLSSKGNLNLNTSSISNNNSTYSTNSTFYRISRRVLQGIPALSIFALVGIMSASFNPNLQSLIGKIFAVPTCFAKCDAGSIRDCESGLVWSTTLCTCVKESTDDIPIDASSSLTIDDNTIKDNITAVRGDIAYASHNIKVNASDIASYALTITGPTNLTTTDSNGNAVSGGTTITGAGGKTGSTMSDNTWGYGWGSSNAVEANLTYNSFTGSAQTLSSGNANSNHTVSLDNKLVFAAKFSDNATEGHYTARVSLNLAVTPRALSTLEQIANMQDMNSTICANAAVGDTARLTDTRDNSTYTVAKLSDGKCWMTQNLRIVNKTISSTDSDMTSGSFTIPASSTSGFSSDTASNAYYGSNTTYGAYYSWCAATAGSCSSATTAGANATNSICPKGWKLPVGTPGTGTNDFAKAIGLATTNIVAGTNYWSSLSSPSFANNALTVNGITWPAAGLYANSSARNVGTYGYHWSRTASSSITAYYFIFHSGGVNPANGDYRRGGCSVRCVAYSS